MIEADFSYGEGTVESVQVPVMASMLALRGMIQRRVGHAGRRREEGAEVII